MPRAKKASSSAQGGVLPLMELPEELLDLVLARVASFVPNPRSILALAIANKELYQRLQADQQFWENAWQAYLGATKRKGVTDRNAVAPRGTSAYDRLRLMGVCGCMLCGKARIRSVTWPFRVRCCQDCLYKRTISTYRLRELAPRLTEQQIFAQLPYTTAYMYARASRRDYVLHFVWREQADALVRSVYGKTLAQLSRC